MGKLSTVLDKAQTVGKKLDDAYQARMARAQDMDFKTPAYHGSGYPFWDKRRIKQDYYPDDAAEMIEGAVFTKTSDGGIPGVSLSPSRSTAKAYANMRDRNKGGAVGKFLVRGNIHHDWGKALDEAAEAGLTIEDYLKDYTGVYIPDYDEIRVFDPANIRHVSAKFDPAKKESANLLASAAGAGLVGAAMAPEEAEAGPISRGGKKLIEAWHGSPHKFDKFDINKIGTGEGAQAYGHGLYFADSEGVARGYRDALTRHGRPDKAVMDAFGEAFPSGEAVIGQIHYPSSASFADAYHRGYISSDDVPASLATELERIRGHGALYRAHLDVDPDSLLDWDKPLSEQPRVMEALSNVLTSNGNLAEDVSRYFAGPVTRGGKQNPKGSDLLNVLRKMGADSPENVSASMRQAGIPGIRYKDAMSRGSGERETYNYVMFSDEPISIKERGAADPALLATLSAATAGAPDAIEGLKALATRVMSAIEAYDRPIQNVYGAGRTLYGLTQAETGKDVERALIEGAKVSQQDIGTTAEQIGDKVRGESNSPFVNMMGAAAKYGSMVFGP